MAYTLKGSALLLKQHKARRHYVEPLLDGTYWAGRTFVNSDGKEMCDGDIQQEVINVLRRELERMVDVSGALTASLCRAEAKIRWHKEAFNKRKVANIPDVAELTAKVTELLAELKSEKGTDS
tara:strand:+ start:537 stop:905 length:369 start_codon:yes stop_codon:yes gene_type:complete